VLRSATFALPDKLRFLVCGHDGPPDKPAKKKNFVRLVDAAGGKVLREVAAPRNDIAQRVDWDLAEFTGHSGFVEVTDGDDGEAYAWLGIGRFKPELPQLALNDPKTRHVKRSRPQILHAA
jgi:hypothetical protein